MAAAPQQLLRHQAPDFRQKGPVEGAISDFVRVNRAASSNGAGPVKIISTAAYAPACMLHI